MPEKFGVAFYLVLFLPVHQKATSCNVTLDPVKGRMTGATDVLPDPGVVKGKYAAEIP